MSNADIKPTETHDDTFDGLDMDILEAPAMPDSLTFEDFLRGSPELYALDEHACEEPEPFHLGPVDEGSSSQAPKPVAVLRDHGPQKSAFLTPPIHYPILAKQQVPDWTGLVSPRKIQFDVDTGLPREDPSALPEVGETELPALPASVIYDMALPPLPLRQRLEEVEEPGVETSLTDGSTEDSMPALNSSKPGESPQAKPRPGRLAAAKATTRANAGRSGYVPRSTQKRTSPLKGPVTVVLKP